jgi:hypothetical protein
MTAKDVKDVIESEDDFGHEMRVGHVFQKIAASIPIGRQANMGTVKHGETYIDPITNKDRQFDYRCQIRFDDGTPLEFRYCVLLAVECKNLHKSSPLVVCGRQRTFEEAYHTFVESIFETSSNLRQFARKIDHSSFYPANSFVGKSLVRLQLDGNSKLKTVPQADIYDKWAQAVTSGKEMAKESGHFAKIYGGTRFWSFVLPIVVVPDGLLWTATYDITGKIQGEPTLVQTCEFFIAARSVFHGTNSPFILTHIHFVTLRGFTALLKSLVDNPVNQKSVIFSENSERLPPSAILTLL